MSKKKQMGHNVVCTYDDSPEMQGMPIYTCHTKGCNKASIRQKPGMVEHGWLSLRGKFLKKHPTSNINYRDP